MSKFFLILPLIFSSWSSSAFAKWENDQGFGGDVVVCRTPANAIQSIELIDFFEARTNKAWSIDLKSTSSVDENVKILLDRVAFSDTRPKKRLEPFYASFFQEAEFVSGLSLVDIPEPGRPALPSGCIVEQIVVHQKPVLPGDARYIINKDLWDQLDSVNKAGLIFHEITFRTLEKQKEAWRVLRTVVATVAANQIKNLHVVEVFELIYDNLGISKMAYDDMLINQAEKFDDIAKGSILFYCATPVPGKSKTFSFNQNANLTVTLQNPTDAYCSEYVVTTKITSHSFEIRTGFNADSTLPLEAGTAKGLKVSFGYPPDARMAGSFKFGIKTDLNGAVIGLWKAHLDGIRVNGSEFREFCGEVFIVPEASDSLVKCQTELELLYEGIEIPFRKSSFIRYSSSLSATYSQSGFKSSLLEDMKYKKIEFFKRKPFGKMMEIDFWDNGNTKSFKTTVKTGSFSISDFVSSYGDHPYSNLISQMLYSFSDRYYNTGDPVFTAMEFYADGSIAPEGAQYVIPLVSRYYRPDPPHSFALVLDKASAEVVFISQSDPKPIDTNLLCVVLKYDFQQRLPKDKLQRLKYVGTQELEHCNFLSYDPFLILTSFYFTKPSGERIRVAPGDILVFDNDNKQIVDIEIPN